MRAVAVTGVGLCCALGDDVVDVQRRIDSGQSAATMPSDHRAELGVRLAEVQVDVRPLLKRRKDRKLLPRAAHMGIPAAVNALGLDRDEHVGLYLGVGREPPEDATEASILASQRGDALDVHALGDRGLVLYPPLASLRTLPNLVLAHIGIQLDLTGPSATLAGDGAAGLAAVVRAVHDVAEGRVEVALAGGADSLVHAVQVRDAVRRGWAGVLGEAAALVRLEPLDRARARGAVIQAVVDDAIAGVSAPKSCELKHHMALGRCGAADGSIALVLALMTASAGRLRLHDETGAFAALCWQPYGEATP